MHPQIRLRLSKTTLNEIARIGEALHCALGTRQDDYSQTVSIVVKHYWQLLNRGEINQIDIASAVDAKKAAVKP